MSFILSCSKKDYKVGAVGYLEKALCLPNNYVFLYFSEGAYQIWNLLENKFVFDGHLEKDLRYFKLFSKSEIVYYSFVNKELKIYDIYEKKERPITAKVPTKAALPDNERNDANIKTLYEEGTNLEFFDKSNLILLFETRINSNNNDIVITVFDTESNPFFFQTSYPNPNKKIYKQTLLNNTHLIAVWNESFNEQPLEFSILNVMKKESGFRKITLSSTKLNCEILEIFGWHEDQVGILANNNIGSPFLKIIDYEKDLLLMDLDVNEGGRANIVTEFFKAEPKNDLMVFSVENQKGHYICCFEPGKKALSLKKWIDPDVENGMAYKDFSRFANYYVQYENDAVENPDSRILMKTFSFIPKKFAIGYLMERKGIFAKYGQLVVEEAIKFLIE